MDKQFQEDYFSKRNIVVLCEEVTSESAARIVAQIAQIDDSFEQESVPREERIATLWVIDSPGGSISAGLAILGAMDHARMHGVRFSTISSGMVASMAFVVAAYGDKGMRKCLAYTQFLMHQPLGAAQGQASDIIIRAKHIESLRMLMNSIIAERTGQPIDQIEHDTDRDKILTAEEAIDYGICDEILSAKSI